MVGYKILSFTPLPLSLLLSLSLTFSFFTCHNFFDLFDFVIDTCRLVLKGFKNPFENMWYFWEFIYKAIGKIFQCFLDSKNKLTKAKPKYKNTFAFNVSIDLFIPLVPNNGSDGICLWVIPCGSQWKVRDLSVSQRRRWRAKGKEIPASKWWVKISIREGTKENCAKTFAFYPQILTNSLLFSLQE